MSRTTLPDGSVRFSPDRGHRSKRKVPASQVAIPLAAAAPVGLLGARGVGLAGTLAIAGVTAVVTVVLVVLWRVTLPRLVSVTVTPTHVRYRRYGRQDVVERSAHTHAAVRTVRMQAGLESPYLIASCDGDGFMLNTDLWTEDDLAQVAAALSTETITPPATPTTVAEVKDEFPGAMSFNMAHPNWTAIIAIAVALPLVGTAMWAFGAWSQDESEDAPTPRQTSAAVAPDLSPERGAEQNSLLSRTQRVFGADSRWEGEPPSIGDCVGDTGGTGWQRILVRHSDDGSSVIEPGADPQREIAALAEAAGMTSTEPSTEPGAGASTKDELELSFQDPATGAFLRVGGSTVKGSDLSVESGSACVESR